MESYLEKFGSVHGKTNLIETHLSNIINLDPDVTSEINYSVANILNPSNLRMIRNLLGMSEENVLTLEDLGPVLTNL